LTELQQIRFRLDDIERLLAKMQVQPPITISESELLSMPDHLRKTLLVVASKGRCTATEVSISTGRVRAVESAYLNELTRAGWLTKQREGKNCVFKCAKARVKVVHVGGAPAGI